MPQLNPAPWFTTACLIWAAFLIILLPKFIQLTLPNSPLTGPTSPCDSTQSLSNPPSWNWPWSQASSTNS